MTTVTIHQPDFAPWLGFFDRLNNADIFVVLDDAQFLKNGWHNRDKIKNTNGQPLWLTVPVLTKGRGLQKINEVKINLNGNWKDKHLKTLYYCYKDCEHFKDVYWMVEIAYASPEKSLLWFNFKLILNILEMLTNSTDKLYVYLASELGIKDKATNRLVKICQHFGADKYLSGIGAKEYLEVEKFEKAGIEVVWQQFEHPVYPQQFGEFVPGLSALDYLFNCGPSELWRKKHGETMDRVLGEYERAEI